jgi:hypothetical protein
MLDMQRCVHLPVLMSSAQMLRPLQRAYCKARLQLHQLSRSRWLPSVQVPGFPCKQRRAWRGTAAWTLLARHSPGCFVSSKYPSRQPCLPLRPPLLDPCLIHSSDVLPLPTFSTLGFRANATFRRRPCFVGRRTGDNKLDGLCKRLASPSPTGQGNSLLDFVRSPYRSPSRLLALAFA